MIHDGKLHGALSRRIILHISVFSNLLALLHSQIRHTYRSRDYHPCAQHRVLYSEAQRTSVRAACGAHTIPISSRQHSQKHVPTRLSSLVRSHDDCFEPTPQQEHTKCQGAPNLNLRKYNPSRTFRVILVECGDEWLFGKAFRRWGVVCDSSKR